MSRGVRGVVKVKSLVGQVAVSSVVGSIQAGENGGVASGSKVGCKTRLNLVVDVGSEDCDCITLVRNSASRAGSGATGGGAAGGGAAGGDTAGGGTASGGTGGSVWDSSGKAGKTTKDNGDGRHFEVLVEWMS